MRRPSPASDELSTRLRVTALPAVQSPVRRSIEDVQVELKRWRRAVDEQRDLPGAVRAGSARIVSTRISAAASAVSKDRAAPGSPWIPTDLHLIVAELDEAIDRTPARVERHAHAPGGRIGSSRHALDVMMCRPTLGHRARTFEDHHVARDPARRSNAALGAERHRRHQHGSDVDASAVGSFRGDPKFRHRRRNCVRQQDAHPEEAARIAVRHVSVMVPRRFPTGGMQSRADIANECRFMT